MYTDVDRAKLEDKFIFLPFVRSGVPNMAWNIYGRRHGFNYKVVSMDTQDLPEDMKHLGLNHVIVKDGDWEATMETIIEEHGQPAVIISHSPCTYNSNIHKNNHRRDGGMTDVEHERLELKEYWIKECCFKFLNMEIPVVIVENPQGYMDRVITYEKGKKAYVKVHPWMFASLIDSDVCDLHDKITHLFSGGCWNAIQEHPLENYLTTTDRMDGIEKGWVINIRGVDASNLRSKTPPGMALAMAACAIDRFLCFTKMHCGYVTLEYHPSKLMKTPKKTEQCNHPLSNGQLCNLRHGHRDSSDNHKRGLGNECGIFCYETNQYLYTEPPYKHAKRWRSDSDSMFDLLPFQVVEHPVSDLVKTYPRPRGRAPTKKSRGYWQKGTKPALVSQPKPKSAKEIVYKDGITAAMAQKVANRTPVKMKTTKKGLLCIYKFYKKYTVLVTAEQIIWRKKL